MTSLHSTFKLWILPILLLVAISATAGDVSELNQVDDKGLRQGYWIIKGYMSEEMDFSANATVEEGNYINNFKEGLWKKYYPDGTIHSEITYVNDRPYGPYTIYYDNGQVEEKSTWHRNKNVGEFKRFHENGEPQQEFFFADSGKRNGVQRYFHENGQLALEVNIVNGKEEGAMRRYYENGKLKEVKTLNNGAVKKGSTRTFGGNAPREKKTTTPEQEEEVIVSASPEEDEHTNEAHKFEPNGHNILYNALQQVTQVGDFKNGRLWNGKWYRYNQDGILVRIEIYKNGKYIGTGVIDEEE